MADAKKPDQKESPNSPTRPDDPASELSDEQLDKVAGGLARQRFDGPRPRPISNV
jgi:hypothetical protein